MARKAKQLEPQADSQAETGTEGMAEAQPEPFTSAGQETPAQADGGNVSSTPGCGPAAELAAEPRARAREVSSRLKIDGRWPEAELLKNDMIKEARANGMTRPEAQEWAYSELDRLYPPLPQNGGKAQSIALLDSPKPSQDNDLSKSVDSGRVQGLGDLPLGWPELPANASLAAEIGWVQANRLYVVEELDRGGTRVHLDRAHEPAPSRAAIGWLETSIRSYAKYVEVAAKATGAGQDEQAQERAERMDLEDIRSLLAEML